MILVAKNLRIEELSASVARLEEELARAPAAGDADRLRNDVADLRARVQERDVQVARLVDLERELSRAWGWHRSLRSTWTTAPGGSLTEDPVGD